MQLPPVQQVKKKRDELEAGSEHPQARVKATDHQQARNSNCMFVIVVVAVLCYRTVVQTTLAREPDQHNKD